MVIFCIKMCDIWSLEFESYCLCWNVGCQVLVEGSLSNDSCYGNDYVKKEVYYWLKKEKKLCFMCGMF